MTHRLSWHSKSPTPAQILPRTAPPQPP